MKKFREFIDESISSGEVHRVDSGNTPKNWASGARHYEMSADKSESGAANRLKPAGAGYQKVKGVFAHEHPRDAARYAAGRNWIHHEDEHGNHHLILPHTAKKSGWDKKPVTTTSFHGKHFKPLGNSGEHFAETGKTGMLPSKRSVRSNAGTAVKKHFSVSYAAPGVNLQDHAKTLNGTIHGIEQHD